MNEKKASKSPKKKRHLGAILVYLVGLVAGACAGYFGADAIDAVTGGDDGLFLMYIAVMLLGLYLALFVQIVVHEGGHLVFGKLTGYRFVSFNIFGFIWSRDENGKLCGVVSIGDLARSEETCMDAGDALTEISSHLSSR